MEEHDRSARPPTVGAGLQRRLIGALMRARRALADPGCSLLPALPGEPVVASDAERLAAAAAEVDRARALFRAWKKALGPAYPPAVARLKAVDSMLSRVMDETATPSIGTAAAPATRRDLQALLRRCEVDAVVLVAAVIDRADVVRARKRARRKARKALKRVLRRPTRAHVAFWRRWVRRHRALAEAASSLPGFPGRASTFRLASLEDRLDALLAVPAADGGRLEKRTLSAVLAEGRRLYGRRRGRR